MSELTVPISAYGQILTLCGSAPHSIVSTIDHDLHRQRRNALNSFFSVASVRRLEPIMKSYLTKMMARLEQSGKSGEVVQIHHVFMACASDIITQYAFGECLNFIDEWDYGRWYFQATDWFFFLTHVFALAPGLVHHAQNIPKWSLKIFAPFLEPLRDRQDVCITDAKLCTFSSINFGGAVS